MFLFQNQGVMLGIKGPGEGAERFEVDISKLLQSLGIQMGKLSEQQLQKLEAAILGYLKSDADMQKFAFSLKKNAGITLDDSNLQKISKNTVDWLNQMMVGDIGRDFAACLFGKVCTEIYTVATGDAGKLLGMKTPEKYAEEFERVTYLGASKDVERASLQIAKKSLELLVKTFFDERIIKLQEYEHALQAISASVKYLMANLIVREDQHKREKTAELIEEHEKKDGFA